MAAWTGKGAGWVLPLPGSAMAPAGPGADSSGQDHTGSARRGVTGRAAGDAVIQRRPDSPLAETAARMHQQERHRKPWQRSGINVPGHCSVPGMHLHGCLPGQRSSHLPVLPRPLIAPLPAGTGCPGCLRQCPASHRMPSPAAKRGLNPVPGIHPRRQLPLNNIPRSRGIPRWCRNRMQGNSPGSLSRWKGRQGRIQAGVHQGGDLHRSFDCP